MPFTMPNFQIMPGNPFVQGLLQGSQVAQNEQNAKQTALQAALLKAKLPYAGQQAQQQLLQAQLANQYQPQLWQADIGLKGAQTNLTSQEAKYAGPKAQAEIQARQAAAQQAMQAALIDQFKRQHPGYLGGGTTSELQGLVDMGAIPPFNKNYNSGSQNSSVNGSYTPMNQPSSMIPDGNSAGSLQQSPNMTNPLTTQQPGSVSAAPFNTGNPLADSILNRPFANASYAQKMSTGFDWVHATPEVKTYSIAQAAGAGIDPTEALHALAGGKTIPQMLEERGFDPKNPPPPDFLPTRGNIQTLKTRQAALEEVKSLGDFIAKGLGPYSRTINGMSIPQMKDALSGKNKDQQINFLAARALAPEMSNLRLLLAQGRTGITAVHEMEDKSLMDMKAIQALVSPDVFEGAQKLINNKLGDAFGNAEKVYSVGHNKSSGAPSSGKNNDPLGIR